MTPAHAFGTINVTSCTCIKVPNKLLPAHALSTVHATSCACAQHNTRYLLRVRLLPRGETLVGVAGALRRVLARVGLTALLVCALRRDRLGVGCSSSLSLLSAAAALCWLFPLSNSPRRVIPEKYKSKKFNNTGLLLLKCKWN